MISEDEERVIIEAMMSQQQDMRDCHASQTPPKRTPRNPTRKWAIDFADGTVRPVE